MHLKPVAGFTLLPWRVLEPLVRVRKICYTIRLTFVIFYSFICTLSGNNLLCYRFTPFYFGIIGKTIILIILILKLFI